MFRQPPGSALLLALSGEAKAFPAGGHHCPRSCQRRSYSVSSANVWRHQIERQGATGDRTLELICEPTNALFLGDLLWRFHGATRA